MCDGDAADFGGGRPRAMLAPDAERRVTAEKEKIIYSPCRRVGKFEGESPYRRYRRTDAKPSRTRIFFSAVNTNDLDFLSLVGSVKGTLISERTELCVSAQQLFG